MASYSSLNGPGSVGDAVLPIAFLTDEDFSVITGLIQGSRSFSPRKEEISNLSERTSIAPDTLEFVFVALSFLYNHIQDSLKSGLIYADALSSTIEELAVLGNWDESNTQTMRLRLEQLLEPSVVHETFRKIERIRAGFHAHAVGFSSLVELRPKFTDDAAGSMTIDGFVPSIEFRVTTDATDGKHVVFQLTTDALSELKKAVQRLDQKVNLLKRQDLASIQIIDL